MLDDYIIQVVREFPQVIDNLSLQARLMYAYKAAPLSRDEIERRLARLILGVERAFLRIMEESGGTLPFNFWTDYARELRNEIAGPLRKYIEQSFSNYSDYVEFIDRVGAIEDIDTLMTRAIEEVAKGVSDNSRRQFEKLMGEGVNYEEIIERMAIRFSSGHAEQIAVTELTRAEGYFSDALQSRLAEQGAASQIRWLTSEDEKVCPICAPLDHKLKKDGGWDTKFGKIERPPAHPNCILPGNEVLAPDLIGASKAFYVGGAIEFTFASGRKLSVTENHPILTPLGFVSAKFLHCGDDVISASNVERILQSIDPNNNHVPTAIEQVFSAFKKADGVISRTVPTSPEDFHGDARLFNGDVDIVNMDCFLLDDRDASRGEVRGQDGFGNGDVVSSELIGNGADGFFDDRDDAPAPGGMCRADLMGALSVAHPGPLDAFRLGLAADMDAAFDERISNNLPTHTDLERKFLRRFSGDIATDNIIDIRYFDFSGHVYDLQTRMYELYICNGIIVKNCRCKTVVELMRRVPSGD